MSSTSYIQKTWAKGRNAATRLGNKAIKRMKATSREPLKSLAYKPVNREIIRSGKDKIPSHLLNTTISSTLQRVASETLPEGFSYAKITIRDWQRILGKDFELKVDGKTVFGNRIERPQRGFHLEYRNIVLPTTDMSRIDVSETADFSIHFSPGTYSTPQQDKFDAKYGVTQKDNLFYNLRGNTNAPEKLIVTFPGFGPSASRVSYAVSFLKWIDAHDLRDAALLTFQDRYGVAGTYMSADNSEQPLMPTVVKEIRKVADRYGIRDENILFFGASKGGSIALMAAESFRNSELVVVVPQLNLPYYFSKPFFIHNLFLNPVLKSITQPGELFLRYLEEGRRIHYLYSANDELSNYSLVEFASVSPTFTAYRFSCAHGQVAGQGVALLAYLFRSFLGTAENRQDSLRFFDSIVDGQKTYFQAVKTSVPAETPSLAMARIHTADGNFYQQITQHETVPHEFHSGHLQYLDADFFPIDGPVSLVTFDQDGARTESDQFEVAFASPLETQIDRVQPTMLPRLVDKAFTYPVYDNGLFNEVDIIVQNSSSKPDGVLAIIDSPETFDTNLPEKLLAQYEDYLIARISTSEPTKNVSIAARRISAQYDTENLVLFVNRPDADAELHLELANTEWINLQVLTPTAIDSSVLSGADLNDFKAIIRSGRLKSFA